MKCRWDGQAVRGLRYTDVGHGEGSWLWWKNRCIHIHLSRGTLRDFHSRLIEAPDSLWRGRSEPARCVLTIQPPTPEFLSGALSPAKLVSLLARVFRPRTILVDTRTGWLRRVRVVNMGEGENRSLATPDKIRRAVTVTSESVRWTPY